MRRVNTLLLSSVFPLTNGHPGLPPRFTGLYALVPCVLKSCVTSTSTDFEPGTAMTATTHFPRFQDDAAFGTYKTEGRRRD